MNLLLAALAGFMAFYSLFWRGDIHAALAFMAWGSALLNRHEIEELKASAKRAQAKGGA